MPSAPVRAQLHQPCRSGFLGKDFVTGAAPVNQPGAEERPEADEPDEGRDEGGNPEDASELELVRLQPTRMSML